jgi:hypothetical protein
VEREAAVLESQLQLLVRQEPITLVAEVAEVVFQEESAVTVVTAALASSSLNTTHLTNPYSRSKVLAHGLHLLA